MMKLCSVCGWLEQQCICNPKSEVGRPMSEIPRWDVELFGRSVLCCYCKREIDAINAFEVKAYRKDGGPLELELLNDSKGWVQDRNGDVYIWATTPSTLIHEFVHAAFRLCSLVDLKPQEELIARLVQYMKLNIMDEIGEVDQ